MIIRNNYLVKNSKWRMIGSGSCKSGKEWTIYFMTFDLKGSFGVIAMNNIVNWSNSSIMFIAQMVHHWYKTKQSTQYVMSYMLGKSKQVQHINVAPLESQGVNLHVSTWCNSCCTMCLHASLHPVTPEGQH